MKKRRNKKMDKIRITEIMRRLDHTVLSVTATTEDIKMACELAIKYMAKSVCVPPCYVKKTSRFVDTPYGRATRVCTVIGFPNGYSSTEIKVAEAAQAVRDGADEVDMVVNIGMIKDRKYQEAAAEIMEVRKAINKESPDHGIVLKVILETDAINAIQAEKMCTVCALAGADYVKTSTGFGNFKGATPGMVNVLAEAAKKANEAYGTNLKVKASGGIRTVQDALKMIEAGADRIGASSVIRNFKEMEYLEKAQTLGMYAGQAGDYWITPCMNYSEYVELKKQQGLNALMLDDVYAVMGVHRDSSENDVYITVEDRGSGPVIISIFERECISDADSMNCTDAIRKWSDEKNVQMYI